MDKVSPGKPKGAKDKVWDRQWGGRFANQTAHALKRTQRELRYLAMSLNETQDDAPRIRKQIRKKLEVLSLLFACRSQDGAEFRVNSALAVDLSGWKREAAGKIREKERRKNAKAARTTEMIRRNALVDREQDAEANKDHTF